MKLINIFSRELAWLCLLISIAVLVMNKWGGTMIPFALSGVAISWAVIFSILYEVTKRKLNSGCSI